jgi:GNAT superfamily N-acetyltransferase
MSEARVSILNSEPIFPVADVVATVRYYRSVLGFETEWLWGDPPDFGGVRWGRIGVMFSQHAEPDAKIGGQWHAFHVSETDSLYRLHVRNGAVICTPLEAKPWGMQEYTVRDINGHYLRFGEPLSNAPPTHGHEPASNVAIVERLPTVEEYLRLIQAVGWFGNSSPERTAMSLAGARYGVVAVDGDLAVGTGLVLGDGTTFSYLKDIIVHPEWQRRKVGSRIVEALLAMIEQTAEAHMLVALFTGRNRAEFYEQFGFAGPESGLYGMSLQIDRKQR